MEKLLKSSNSQNILFFSPPIFTDEKKLALNNVSHFENKYLAPYSSLVISSYIIQKMKNIQLYVIPLDPFLFDFKILSDVFKIRDWERNYKKNFFAFINKMIRKYHPKLIGVSLGFAIQEKYAYLLINYIKNKFSYIKVIVGGNHASFTSKKILTSTKTDIVVKKEGEKKTIKLVNSLLYENNLDTSISGISFKKGNNIVNNNAKENNYVEEIGPLNFNLIKLPKEINYSDFEWYIEISRGCPYNCSFCTTPAMWGKKLKYKNKKYIRDEIKFLVKNDVTEIGISDDTFSPEYAYKNNIFDINIKKNVNFFCETHINTIYQTDTLILKKLYDKGLKTYYLGIESINEKILRNMNKKINKDKIFKVLQKLKNIGIKVKTFWIVGHPASSEVDDRDNIKFIRYLFKKKLIDEVIPHIFKPLPGSKDFLDKRLKFVNEDYYFWEHTGENIFPSHYIIDAESGQIKYSAKSIKKVFDDIYRLQNEYS